MIYEGKEIQMYMTLVLLWINI